MDTITTAAPTTPLRQRMLDDMMMRGFGTHTQKDYIRHVRCFAAFLGRFNDLDLRDACLPLTHVEQARVIL